VNSEFTFKLVREMQGKAEGNAALINTLRRDLAEANIRAQESVVKEAEAEAPLKALDEFTDYLVGRTREEREAQSETGLWVRPPASPTAFAVHADLCTKLDQIRTSYGL